MKARLLIGVLTCAIMLAILATVGGVTSAFAHKAGSPDCNSSNSGKWAVADVPTFTPNGGSSRKDYIEWTQKCGSSSDSVEAELQSSSDGVHWTDVVDSGGSTIDHEFATDSGHAGVQWSRASGDTITCNINLTYRTHVWISGSDSTSGAVSCW